MHSFNVKLIKKYLLMSTFAVSMHFEKSLSMFLEVSSVIYLRWRLHLRHRIYCKNHLSKKFKTLRLCANEFAWIFCFLKYLYENSFFTSYVYIFADKITHNRKLKEKKDRKEKHSIKFFHWEKTNVIHFR